MIFAYKCPSLKIVEGISFFHVWLIWRCWRNGIAASFQGGRCSNNHFCSKCWISSGFSISKSQVKSSQYQGDWHGTKLENLWMKRSPRSKTRIKHGSFKNRLSSCIIMCHHVSSDWLIIIHKKWNCGCIHAYIILRYTQNIIYIVWSIKIEVIYLIMSYHIIYLQSSGFFQLR